MTLFLRSVRKTKVPPYLKYLFLRDKGWCLQLPRQLATLEVLLANLCWSVKSFAKRFLHRPLWCWDQSKIEVGRTVIAGNIISVVSVFHN